MTIDEILAAWNTDARIDISKLDEHVCDNGLLLGKYLEILSVERRLLARKQNEHNRIIFLLTKYYGGFFDEDDLKELNLPPYRGKPRSGKPLEAYIEGNVLAAASHEKLAAQRERVKVLEEIIKYIHARGYQFKTALDFVKHRSGLDIF